jgi:hypothetical protein
LEGSSLTKRCSFVFGGQQFDQLVTLVRNLLLGELHQKDAVQRGSALGPRKTTKDVMG